MLNPVTKFRRLGLLLYLAGVVGLVKVQTLLAPPHDVLLGIVFFVGLLALMPVAEKWMGQKIRDQRGKCVCGYDLRETPYRCPECGRVIQPRPWYERQSDRP